MYESRLLNRQLLFHRLSGMLLGIALLALPQLQASAAERVALVIGNDQYKQAPLDNPVNDAKAIGELFSQMGFKVVSAYNANRTAMEDALEDFGQEAEQANIAVAYYAGHGIQVDGENYLIPSNTRVRHRRDLRKLIHLSDVMAEVQLARGLGVVMLDACRDNPFGRQLQQSYGRSIGGRGLSRVEDTPGNVMVAFATQANAIADDGKGQDNSPYAQALMKYLPQSGLEVRLLFGKVHDEVKQNTHGKQRPYTYGAIGGNQWYLSSLSTQPFEPEMVFIKGGRFMMGSPASEKDRYSNEKQHRVTVGDFYMGKYEVSIGEYLACVDAGGCTEPEWREPGNPYHIKTGSSDYYKKHVSDVRKPIVGVSWHQAQAYANWLRQRTGKGYRLPSEAQWEYAARGGSKTAYYWGNTVGKHHANCYRCGSRWDSKTTAPRDSFASNPYGLHDMLGNVSEWTCSAYDENYGGSEKVCANTNDSRSRVLRGGSWYSLPRPLRSAYRFRGTAEGRSVLVGFRVSRTP